LYLGPRPGPPFASHYIAYDCSSSYLAPWPGYKTPFPPPYNFMFGGKDRAEGAGGWPPAQPRARGRYGAPAGAMVKKRRAKLTGPDTAP